MILERVTTIEAPLESVWEFFSNPENLARITPPSLGFQIVSSPRRPIRAGDRIDYRIRVAGIPLAWRTLITECDPPRAFTDVQEKGPYRRWEHRHTFEPLDGGLVRMTDRVDYELPLGALGRIAGGFWVRRQLRQIFDHRARVVVGTFAPAAEP